MQCGQQITAPDKQDNGILHHTVWLTRLATSASEAFLAAALVWRNAGATIQTRGGTESCLAGVQVTHLMCIISYTLHFTVDFYLQMRCKSSNSKAPEYKRSGKKF